jgi:hypothetical protein
LDYRIESLQAEATLFAGGWMHEKGGGKFLNYADISTVEGGTFWKVITTLPMIKGDSGSPLIDRQGRLCGVLTTMQLGMVVKMKPKSTAIMMKQSEIDYFIRRDRAQQEGSD